MKHKYYFVPQQELVSWQHHAAVADLVANSVTRKYRNSPDNDIVSCHPADKWETSKAAYNFRITRQQFRDFMKNGTIPVKKVA